MSNDEPVHIVYERKGAVIVAAKAKREKDGTIVTDLGGKWRRSDLGVNYWRSIYMAKMDLKYECGYFKIYEHITDEGRPYWTIFKEKEEFEGTEKDKDIWLKKEWQ